MRALAALLLALPLAACGFRPLYAETAIPGGASAAFASIAVDAITSANDAEEIGLDLERALHDVLSQPGNAPAPVYRLRVRLTDERRPLAIQDDSSIARYTYRLSARWTLLPANAEEETKPLAEGAAQAIASYNVVDSQFATVVARRDAEKRAARDVAEQIRLRLAAALATGS